MAAAAAAAASGDGKGCDFYGALGLEKNCTPHELRTAYKRLALRWHPDRCLGNPGSVMEAKKKFQRIQEAYSVLSDSNKRFSYDIGMYQNDDGDDNDMGEFLSEMASMMNQTKPCENGEESFKQLQDLFDEMFQDDIGLSNPSPFSFNSRSSSCASSSPSSFSSSSFNNCDDNSNSTRKRHSPDNALDSANISNAQIRNLNFGSGNASSSSSSSNVRKIKRRNSGSNIP